MDLRDVIQIINTALAILAIPPSFYLIKAVIADKKIIAKEHKGINNILTVLFIGVALSSILNAVISILALSGNGFNAHFISPYARSFVNLFFSFIAWNLYSFHKRLKGK